MTDQERAEVARAVEQVLMDTGSSRFSIQGTIVPPNPALNERVTDLVCKVMSRTQRGEPAPEPEHVGRPRSAMGFYLTHETWWATSLVLQERLRQIEVEGFTPEQDRHHEPGALASAGATYLMPDDKRILMGGQPIQWPFEEGRYKPADRERDIVRGLALGLAELERLRAEP